MGHDDALLLAQEMRAVAAHAKEALVGFEHILRKYPEAAQGQVLVANLVSSLREGIRMCRQIERQLGADTPEELSGAISSLRMNLRHAIELAGPKA